MRTLYRQFIVATMCILGVSMLLGLILANFVYVKYTKENMVSKNLATAQSVVDNLQRLHGDEGVFSQYLNAVSELGYQLYVVNENGEGSYYGEAFDNAVLDDEIAAGVLAKEIYTGKSGLWNQAWMMNHFSNKVENTVGVPVQFGDRSYALFIKPNSQLLFSDFHAVLMGFIFAVMIVSIIGVIWMAKQLIRPISQLTEATKAVFHENFNYKLNIRRNDEIGQLAESFHMMQVQLKRNDEVRKTFISNVSHDFQSPLMNIQGYAELLQHKGIVEEERSAYAQIIQAEAKRLSNLTKQLLLITSLDQDRYPLKLEPMRLDLQLKEIIRKYQWRLHDQSIEISYKLEEITLITDNELLTNVWENLLSNAIKYNRENGYIYITCKQTSSHIHITFEDKGVGIPDDAMPYLFDRFYRVDKARKKDGTGLGLSIVQQIVQLLNGRISVTSELGEGSRFEITFEI